MHKDEMSAKGVPCQLVGSKDDLQSVLLGNYINHG